MVIPLLLALALAAVVCLLLELWRIDRRAARQLRADHRGLRLYRRTLDLIVIDRTADRP